MASRGAPFAVFAVVLTHTADRRALVHLAAASASLALVLGHSLAWWPLHLFLVVHLVAVQHNHAHVPLFRAAWANRLFDVWSPCLCGLPMFAWRTHHLAHHHAAPWSARDWSSPYRTADDATADRPMSLRVYQIRYGPLFWGASARWILRKGGRQHRVRCAIEVVGFGLASAALAAAAGPWRWALAVLPSWWLCGVALGAVNYYQHWRARSDDGEVAAWTFTCRIHNYLNYNVGYHWLHHLRPGLHWAELSTQHARDASYAPAHLVEAGAFPGYLPRARRLGWLAAAPPRPIAVRR